MHSWRFKLKFSPDKVDTMVVQSIALLDDLDKEINIYSMRVKVCYTLLIGKRFFCWKKLTPSQEWYGWHFPEMGKILTDSVAYAKVVRAIGAFIFFPYLLLYWTVRVHRLPHERRKHFPRPHPPRRARTNNQSSRRNLHGHRNLRIRPREHQRRMRSGHCNLRLSYTARWVSAKSHECNRAEPDSLSRWTRRRAPDQPRW